MEEGASLPVLLISANVGSVFEDPSNLLKPWIDEFLAMVTSLRPSFMALHMQEVGGKTYAKSMEYVQDFIKQLCEAEELVDYNRIRVYLDEDYNSAEHFTALGNLYFALNTVQVLRMWNFMTHEWETVTDKVIHTGNIESVASKEKAKFPRHFFPECKWSRKGFLRTRWDVEGTVMDMVNIHLFHDASNLAACEEFPSVYCKSRRRALIHTLDRFQRDAENVPVPYFVFGDFNFRCDTEGVVKKLTEDLTVHQVLNDKPVSNDRLQQVAYKDAEGATVLSVGKKEFIHAEHQTKFKETWLRKFDRELDPLREILFEYPISFPPSYPFEEDPGLPQDYMNSRCPAWCDRILMNPAAKGLIVENAENQAPEYKMIGKDVCMGDHKPIMLSFRLRSSQGIKSCNCNASAVHDPVADNSSILNHTYLHPITTNSRPLEDDDEENYLNEDHSDSDKENKRFKLDDEQEDKYRQEVNIDRLKSLVGCTKCRERFNRIIGDLKPTLGILEPSYCENVDRNNSSANNNNKKSSKRPDLTPLTISINVVDPDNNNLIVCMCSTTDEERDRHQVDKEPQRIVDSVDQLDEARRDDQTGNMDYRVCKRCQNIINTQPVQHRGKLISQRLTMANNIIVNRIDSQFLSTSGLDGKGGNLINSNNNNKHFEPYTPDSMESHSPMLTVDGNGMQSSSSSSSFTMTSTTPRTTATKNSSISESIAVSKSKEDVNIDLIERDTDQNVVVEQSSKYSSNCAPNSTQAKRMSVEDSTERGKLNKNGAAISEISSPGVNANQLKSRLERLQILNRMPKHANRKKYLDLRDEFQNEMRRREENKVNARDSLLCCGGGGQSTKSRDMERSSSCVIM